MLQGMLFPPRDLLLPACNLLPLTACMQVVAKAAAKASAQLDAAVEGYGLAADELESTHTQVSKGAWQRLRFTGYTALQQCMQVVLCSHPLQVWCRHSAIQ